MFPSYAAPRIWRLLAPWIYEIDPYLTTEWAAALPDPFVNVTDLRARDEAEDRHRGRGA